jgi:HAD superfamily hydrolase (TIGR01549 family)
MVEPSGSGIRAVLFDMDGTLLDSVAGTLAAYVRTVRECGGAETTTEAVLEQFGAGSTSSVLAALLGRPTRESDTECFARHLERASEAMVPYDGIDAAVTVLAEAVPVGVVTGATRRSALLLLERAGLRRHFRIVVGGDEVATVKPEPESVLLGCTRIGIAPGHVAYVGDAPTDLEAARRAGIVPVAAAWGHHFDPGIAAELTVGAPADLLGILDSR